MIILQTHVGFLPLLWFLVRSTELAIAHLKANSHGWAIAYSILALLMLFAALLALGFHV